MKLLGNPKCKIPLICPVWRTPGKSGTKFSFAGKQLVHFLIRQPAQEPRFHRNAGNGEGGAHFCVRLLERLINNGGDNFDNLLS